MFDPFATDPETGLTAFDAIISPAIAAPRSEQPYDWARRIFGFPAGEYTPWLPTPDLRPKTKPKPPAKLTPASLRTVALADIRSGV